MMAHNDCNLRHFPASRALDIDLLLREPRVYILTSRGTNMIEKLSRNWVLFKARLTNTERMVLIGSQSAQKAAMQ